MKYLASHEHRSRGSISFPFEIHYLTETHPRYEMPFHWHYEYEFIHVQSGTFTVFVNEGSYTLEAGDSALLFGGSVHGGQPNNASYSCLVFDYATLCSKNFSELAKTISLFETYDLSIYIMRKDMPLAPIAKQLFEAFQGNSLDATHKLEILGSTFLLMGGILSKLKEEAKLSLNAKPNKHMERIKNVLSYMKQNYAEHITLDILAEKADLNAKYLCRYFKQLTGRTPIDYLLYYRMECACEQLIFTDSSITEIALSCGFNDMSYFTKKFRQLKNTTPQSYRVLYQANV